MDISITECDFIFKEKSCVTSALFKAQTSNKN